MTERDLIEARDSPAELERVHRSDHDRFTQSFERVRDDFPGRRSSPPGANVRGADKTPPAGANAAFGRRLDLAFGYRHSQHLEAKAQYSGSNRAGRDGDRLLAVQFVMSL